jgi:hypothetical protein
MKRREPPPLAKWMLRHLTAGDRDEALDGDLLEVFRLGRSNVWYWRQIIAACVISWWSNVYARGPALIFALLWSMLSPVWYSTLNAIEASHNFDKAWEFLGPLWLPVALIGWIAIHAVFLWAALVIYQLVHIVQGKVLEQKDMRRAFWIVPLILPMVYGATFLVANLYWYSLPGLANAKLAATSWGQISDLGTLANFIRFPYFVALLVALWGTVHRIGRDIDPLSVIPEWNGSKSDTIAAAPLPQSRAVHRFLAFMVAAGLVNSMIVATLLCRLPDSHSVGIVSLSVNALIFVAIGTLGGIAGSWLYWISPSSPLRERSPVPFSLFALTCAAGWVWVPAMMLFAEQVSGMTAFVAMFGTFMLATGMRTATYFVFVPSQPKALPWEEGDLFAESLYRAPLELHGYLIALSLFAAGAAIAIRSNYTAASLLAISAFIFAWKKTIPPREAFERDVQMRRAVLRVASAAVPAILLTIWALLDGVAHRNEAATASVVANVESHAARHLPADPRAPLSTSGAGGYESVVLWPYPKKKELVPPLIADDSILAPGTKRPLIIRFEGPYWFLQPPSKRPGPEAHVAQGTPVNVDVESSNAIALVMNAHQKLARAIPTVRCREIEIAIENRDNRPGLVSLGVLLTDEESSPKRTLYLGQQPVVSTEPGRFFVKTTPAYDTLRFSVPPDAPMRRFNEITVMFLPDIEHTFVAPRIAIQQFELYPR